MNNILKKLNKLPKKKLSLRSDMEIRLRLYLAMLKKKLVYFPVAFEFPQVRLIPVIARVLLVLIIVVPGYAYASSSVTDGHLLYPVKTALEQVELNLAKTPAAQVKTYEKLAERRLAEANVLSQKDDDNKEDTIVKTVETALTLSETADIVASTIPKVEVKETVSVAKTKQTESLSQVAQNVGINAEEATVNKIALALDKLKDKKDKPTEEKIKEAVRYEEEIIATTSATEQKDNEKETASSSEQLETPARGFINHLTRLHDEQTEENKDTETIEEPVDTKSQETKEEGKKIEKRSEEVSEDNSAAVEKYLEQAINNIKKLKRDLPRERYQDEDVNSLFKHLDEKVEKAEEAIEDNDVKGFQEILEATDAITNNATSFIKEKNNKNKTNKKNNFLEKFWQKNNSQSDSEQSNNDQEDENENENLNWNFNRKNNNKKNR